MAPPIHQRARLLAALALVFVARVGAQLLQYVDEVDWLPRFERWQSGALPYGALLMAQIAIVAGQVRVISAVQIGRPLLTPPRQTALLVVALGYFAVMVFRLIAGLTFASSGSWLDAPLPSAFHLVLATFLIVWIEAERTDHDLSARV